MNGGAVSLQGQQTETDTQRTGEMHSLYDLDSYVSVVAELDASFGAAWIFVCAVSVLINNYSFSFNVAATARDISCWGQNNASTSSHNQPSSPLQALYPPSHLVTDRPIFGCPSIGDLSVYNLMQVIYACSDQPGPFIAR